MAGRKVRNRKAKKLMAKLIEEDKKQNRKRLFQTIGYWRKSFRQMKQSYRDWLVATEWDDAHPESIIYFIRNYQRDYGSIDEATQESLLLALKNLEKLFDMEMFFKAMQELREEIEKTGEQKK